MSTYYNIYAEANIDGKWYSLCPYFKIDKDKNPITSSIYWAQSIFWEVNNDLEEYAIGRGIPDDMSEGLREVFHEDLQEESDFWGEITWEQYYNQFIYYVNFAQAIVPKVNKDKQYKYEGFVLKKELAEFEVYEREEFSEWLTQIEYNALTDKAKRRYVFYQWNDLDGDYKIYRELADRIWALKDLFADIFECHIKGSLYEGISDSQIRVYVYIS